MRVLLDTNLFISHLLLPHGPSHPTRIVEAGLVGRYTLLVPGEGMEELATRVATKRWLAARIEARDVQVLVDVLLVLGEVIPAITQAKPAISRDRKDDYLLAYAVVGRADYLVTGDDDLLVLHAVGGVTIIRPADFVTVLSDLGLIA